MNNSARIIVAFFFVCTLWPTGATQAQTRGPVVNRDRVQSSPPVVDDKAPIKPARWPFNLGKRLFDRDSSTSDGGDPFLAQGANEQQRLATELAAENGTSAPPANSASVGGVQQSPRVSYPWPKPVDSNSKQQSSADGTTWNETATSNIVDRIREASAKALERTREATAKAPASQEPALSAPQKARMADNVDYAQQAVSNYLQRVQQEGTVSGKVFNPLVGSMSEPAPTGVVQQQPGAATFAGSTVPTNVVIANPGAAVPNYQPTTVSQLPNHVQPGYAQPQLRPAFHSVCAWPSPGSAGRYCQSLGGACCRREHECCPSGPVNACGHQRYDRCGATCHGRQAGKWPILGISHWRCPSFDSAACSARTGSSRSQFASRTDKRYARAIFADRQLAGLGNAGSRHACFGDRR